MSDTIRVLIVDDLAETRENVRKLLQFESDIEVIGQAATGEQAIQMAKDHVPDIILMDINMPGVDGIGASQKITEMLPGVQIIIMSVQSDSNYLRRAMLAGARDFLTKPFGGDELISTVRRVYSKRPTVVVAPVKPQRGGADATAEAAAEREGIILAVFSPKGGSGCTTIAINLAISLAKRGMKTVLVDGSFQFGGVDVMLNMKPVTSIVDATSREGDIDSELISTIVQVHRSGLSVLLAPPKPEMADHITDEGLRKLLSTLRQMYDFIILDTTSTLNDVGLTLLDSSDKIVLVTQQNLPSLKNVSRFFDLTQSLEYEPNKVWMVVNRVQNKQGVISLKDVSETLKRPVFMQVPSDEAVVSAAIDKGVPVVMGANQKQDVSMAFGKLADKIIQESGRKTAAGKTAVESEKPAGFLGRLFGKRASAGG